jgi:hypothetical protein
MAITSFGFPFSYVGNTAWKVLFLTLPWTVLCQGYEIVSTSGDRGFLITLNTILLFQACGFTVLAIYLNACLPDHDGQKNLPWYLIDMRRLYPKVGDGIMSYKSHRETAKKLCHVGIRNKEAPKGPEERRSFNRT